MYTDKNGEFFFSFVSAIFETVVNVFDHGINFKNYDSISSDMYLWRYLDLHKFLSFVSKKSLFFTRLDKFEDKREGITTKHLYFRRIKSVIENDPIFDSLREMITVDVLGSRMNIISKELETIQRFNFANCWLLSRDNFESAAMWSLYSNPNSVAIKIPYKNFKELLLENGFDNDRFGRRIICSPINYKDFQNTNHIFNPDQEEIEDSVFQKDVSFEHEKEFRMILREEPFDIPPVEYHENGNNEHMAKFINQHMIIQEFLLNSKILKSIHFKLSIIQNLKIGQKTI